MEKKEIGTAKKEQKNAKKQQRHEAPKCQQNSCIQWEVLRK